MPEAVPLQLRAVARALDSGHLDSLYHSRIAGMLREVADDLERLRADAVVLLASNAKLRAQTTRAKELHQPGVTRVMHWCSVYGGGMEEAHEEDAPKSCLECGSETAWPCNTYKILEGTQ